MKSPEVEQHINGRLVSGAQPLESFTRVIEDELARVR
jgi:hypothetical protein